MILFDNFYIVPLVKFICFCLSATDCLKSVNKNYQNSKNLFYVEFFSRYARSWKESRVVVSGTTLARAILVCTATQAAFDNSTSGRSQHGVQLRTETQTSG